MVTLVFVAPDMRRQGIATRLTQDLNAYFERKGYRGSILFVETAGAYQLYQKIGYQEAYRELRTQLPPRSNSARLKWAEVKPEDLGSLHQLKKRWASQNFPVLWNPQGSELHQYNMKQYRMLQRGASIISYAKWDDPSEHRPQGLICDPMVPDEARWKLSNRCRQQFPPHAHGKQPKGVDIKIRFDLSVTHSTRQR